MKLIRPFTLAALALVVTRTALAVPVGVELGAGTTAPLDVGAQLTLRLPGRVSVLAELGYLPAPYVALINSTVEAFGGWDETTSELIAESLNSSMVCRLGVGFRPLADWGWALHAGYAVAALGGGTSIAEVVEAATGEAVSAEIGRELPLHSTVHLGFVGTSYAWALRGQWVLTVSLDYVQALASSSGIDLSPRREAGRRLVAALSAAVDEYLNEQYTTYVKVPSIGVALGYRF